MRTRFALSIIAAVMLFGCKNPGKTGLFSGPVEPTLAGQWDGTMQMADNTPTMQMAIEQSNVNIRGSYSAPAVSGASIGDVGTIQGLTTGQSFMMTFTATSPGCVAKIDINGYNAGDELAFNFTGVDCSCSTVSGQGYGRRPG